MTLAPLKPLGAGVDARSQSVPASPQAPSGGKQFPFEPVATWINEMLAIEVPTSQGARVDQDPNCIFCKVHDRTLNAMVRRRGTVYARWDNFPASFGHVEVVPFRHVQSFFDLTPDELRDLYTVSKLVRNDLDKQVRPDSYTIGINDGPAAGRTVPHLHMHIIPRWFGDVPDPRGGIRRIFPECDPDDWLR